MFDSLPPGTAEQGNVITKKVFINDVELSREVLLSQLTVNKSFNKIAFAKIIFLDGSVSERNFSLSNDNKFKPGSRIKIQLGYDGNVTTVFEGIIIKHGIKIRQQGSSILMIEAKDKAIKLTGSRKSAYHLNKTDSTIISDLAGDLQKEVDPTTQLHKQIVQFESTDWDFIVMRAEANSMLVLTDDGKLVVKKPSTIAPPSMLATFGQNIWEFEAEMDARRQFSQVTSHSWNYTQQQNEDSSTGTAIFTENGNLPSTELATVLNAQVKITHSGHLEQGQLQNIADAYALRNQLSKAIGRVRVKGNSSVKPGSVITLAGVGDRFNGNVFVTGVQHHYEGSWQTDIQFGWREEWFFKKENIMEKPAAGLLPGVSGLQIGTVLSTEDQEGDQYRVKVHIPLITSGNDGIWARVATLDAGPNRGVYFRPQRNDEVILGFLSDDPREPIILGYLHSKSTNQSPLPLQQGALQYGFVTKENIKVIFDDTNKRLSLLVTLPGGEKSVVLNNDSQAIELKDENQNTIKMDAQGITIQSNAIVTIKGSMVKIN